MRAGSVEESISQAVMCSEEFVQMEKLTVGLYSTGLQALYLPSSMAKERPQSQ